MLNLLLVICTFLLVVSFCLSVNTLVMVLPFDLPIISKVTRAICKYLVVKRARILHVFDKSANADEKLKRIEICAKYGGSQYPFSNKPHGGWFDKTDW